MLREEGFHGFVELELIFFVSEAVPFVVFQHVRDVDPTLAQGVHDLVAFGLKPRKVREWTTLDLIASYTFNLPAPAAAQVPGLAKDGGKNVKMPDGKEKNVLPVSTAGYSPCGWRAWLNGTTLTLGMQNVFDYDPPFAAVAFGNGYDPSLADVKGRFCYVQLKKKF